MDELRIIIIAFVFILFWCFVFIVHEYRSLNKSYYRITNKEKSLKEKEAALEKKIKDEEHNLYIKNREFDLTVKSKHSELNLLQTQLEHKHKILDSEMQSYPWLASFIADYYNLYDQKTVEYLLYKKNPALKSAQIVALYAKESSKLRYELKQLEYQIAVYESVFPWLIDFKEIPPKEVVRITQSISDSEEDKSEYETLKHWLSPEEYQKLSNAEKYQLALDRYEKRNKSNWEIGREYERYIGYLYEKKGYVVSYVGAVMGFEDLGRDLIAKKDGMVLIIQCKNWAERKIIHEKHIFQLFGSVTEYNIDNHIKANGVFISTCDLSDKAQAFADELKIKYTKKEFIPDYPKIKCNISERTGERIYHLPFDQQYDRVIIEPEKGECYVKTVLEAEQQGFRRAKRYIPEAISNQ